MEVCCLLQCKKDLIKIELEEIMWYYYFDNRRNVTENYRMRGMMRVYMVKGPVQHGTVMERSIFWGYNYE